MKAESEGLTPVVVRLINEQLVWYPPGSGDQPAPLDDDIARERLRSVLAQSRSRVCFAVPAEEVRLLRLEIAAEERKHIERSLPFSLEEQVAADIEELHFAHRELEKLALSVAICSRERMQAWGERLEAFPALTRWLPEPLLLPWQAGEWCLVLDPDRAIVRHGEAEGFGIELPLLAVALEALLAERGQPETVVVYGQDQAGDIQQLPEELRSLVQWRRGSLGSALLLGGEDAVNLRQGEYVPRLPLGRWWRQWRAVAAVFAVALAVHLLATYVDYRGLKQRNLELRTAIEDSYRRAYPRGQAPEPEKQLGDKLAEMRGSSQTSGVVSLLARVGRVIASRPGTAVASINYSDRAGEMRMNILAADFEAVEAIREGINQAGLRAEMENSNAQGDKVRARIRVGGRS